MAQANKLYYTSDDLVLSVKRRANIPDSQDMISNDEILEFANEEMLLNFIPLVYSRHEDYYLVRQVIPLEAGKVRYPIPYRAIATKVREVAYSGSNSGLTEMFRVSVDDITSIGYSGTGHYYFEGEELVINADPSTFNDTGSIVVFYSLRPNALVDSSRVGVITGISTLDDTYTQLNFTELPPQWVIGNEIDFVKTKSPHRVVVYDKLIQDVGTVGAESYITINTVDLPDTIVVGDRVTSAGESDIVNAPSDLHAMLAQMVAERVLESIGDQAGLKAAAAKLAKMEHNSSLILDNRSTGSPIKVRVRNGTLRNSGLGNKGRGYSSNN